jgi:exodeoxyribonuclease III
MKIITWNCNMAFRKKAAMVLQHQPDIVVVQECEHPDKLLFSPEIKKPTSFLWFGKNSNKGLGIFSYSDFKLKLHPSYNEAFKWIIPIKVTDNGTNFILYAVWANNPDDPDGQYVTQVWKAIQYYSKDLKRKNTILTGDFNSNAIWDRPRRQGNHSQVVEALAAKKILSTYHHHFTQEQGKENDPTFYLYKDKTKPYHLDYCFVSSDFMEKLATVEVGEFNIWRQYSDHVPLILTFSTLQSNRQPTV